jgi:hypothetical protein
MSRLFDPQFANVADYDAFIQIFFDDVEDFARMKADPYFRSKVTPDHENFADTKRSRYFSKDNQWFFIHANSPLE